MTIHRSTCFTMALLSLLLMHWGNSHSNNGSQEKQNTYRIMYNDNQIGVLKAQKQKQLTTTTYQLLTEVTATFIKEFHITYNLSVQFDTGSMVKASLTTAVNQSTWDSTHIQWQNSQYRIKKEGESAYYKEKAPCKYATACMYFRKPPSKRVFSEQYTQQVPVNEIKPNVYKLKLPSGNANFYHYDKQGLKKVVVNDTPVQIRFIRI